MCRLWMGSEPGLEQSCDAGLCVASVQAAVVQACSQGESLPSLILWQAVTPASQQALELSSAWPQVQVGPKRHKVDVFMTTDADFNDSVRCYMFLLQSDIFRDRTRGSIYQHVR